MTFCFNQRPCFSGAVDVGIDQVNHRIRSKFSVFPGIFARFLAIIDLGSRLAVTVNDFPDRHHRRFCRHSCLHFGFWFRLRLAVGFRFGLRLGIGFRFGLRLSVGFRFGLRLSIGFRFRLRLGVGFRLGLRLRERFLFIRHRHRLVCYCGNIQIKCFRHAGFRIRCGYRNVADAIHIFSCVRYTGQYGAGFGRVLIFMRRMDC